MSRRLFCSHLGVQTYEPFTQVMQYIASHIVRRFGDEKRNSYLDTTTTNLWFSVSHPAVFDSGQFATLQGLIPLAIVNASGHLRDTPLLLVRFPCCCLLSD